MKWAVRNKSCYFLCRRQYEVIGYSKKTLKVSTFFTNMTIEIFFFPKTEIVFTKLLKTNIDYFQSSSIWWRRYHLIYKDNFLWLAIVIFEVRIQYTIFGECAYVFVRKFDRKLSLDLVSWAWSARRVSLVAWNHPFPI